jgi:uncharacterized membrane protein YfcA
MEIPELFRIDLSLAEFLLFALVGVVTGVINTLAGSGSLITLPIFIFMCGLPPTVANGTNRIGVLLQTAVGFQEFKRQKLTDLVDVHWLVIPSVLGAIVGTYIAVDMSEQLMNNVIGGLMVFMFFVLLLKPSRWLREHLADRSRNRTSLSVVVFFFIGIYGGFIQAGVGIFLLSALVLMNHYSLTSANGVKLFVVLVFSIPALLIFIFNDQVHFGYGMTMAVFQMVGAWLGVRFLARVKNANLWIHRLLLLVVAAAAVKFFAK